jgi:hypothetical protein
MTEDKDKKESSDLLANALFSKGLQQAHDKFKKDADEFRKFGFSETASELNKQARIAQLKSLLMEPSPILSDDENKKYLELLNRRFSVNDNGDIEE